MQPRVTLTPEQLPETVPVPFIIDDHKNSAAEMQIPVWVMAYLEGGNAAIEILPEFQDSFVFVRSNEGTHFGALNQWLNGFNAELDFPLIAAARIEDRFRSAAPLPDQAFGSFYEALIRAASDAHWTGAEKADDYWIRKRYLPGSEAGFITERETWEFLILVTIERDLFASQLDSIFRNLRPRPPPTREQVNAANRVIERFYTGF